MAGLLGMSDDEVYGLAGGLMSAGGGRGFAAGLAGMQEAKQNALKQRLIEAQLGNYASEIEARKLAGVKDARQQSLIESMFGAGATGGQGAASAPGGAMRSAAGGTGGGPATLIDTARKYGIPEQAIQSDMVFNGGKRISEMLEKHGTRDMQVSNGYAYDKNNQGAGFMPSLNTSANGQTSMTRIGPDGLPVVTAPQGAVETFGAYKDAEAGREPFKVFNPDTQREEYTTKQRAAAAANGQQSAPAQQSSGGLPKNYLSAIIGTESGGNPNAVSPKGARGVMQVMPGTNAAPGFGVTPARDGSEQERSRVGVDYLTAMNDKYKDPVLGAIAYNMGPDRTDKWLASGGNVGMLPAETKAYVSSVMTRQAVGGHQERQQSGAFAAGPSAPEKAASDATAGFTKGRAENMVKYESNMNDRVAEGGNLNMRLQESLKAMENFDNGGGKETRARLGQLAQAFGMPDKVVNGVAGGELASMQEFNKLAVQQAMETLKASMGGAGRIAQAEFKVFQANNPNLDTDSRAVRKIFDFNTRLYQRDLAEQKSFNEHVDAKKDPAKFPLEWSAQQAKQGFTAPELSAAPVAQAAPQGKAPVPMKGMTRGGYKFNGGDPSQQSNWVKQ